jgi:DNA-binding MarR family transcriptional regulator
MGRRDDLLRVERSILRIARISLGRSGARRRADRSGVNVSGPGIAILAALRAGAPMRLSTLSVDTHLEAPLVSREVRQLEVDGYVRREPDASDGRAAIVSLTDKGIDAYSRYRAATDEIIAETFDAWNDSDLSRLAKYLDRLSGDFASPE